jgi:hypothetical protein
MMVWESLYVCQLEPGAVPEATSARLQLSDTELERLRDELYVLASVAIGGYLAERNATKQVTESGGEKAAGPSGTQTICG